ncbi:type IV secretory system conjugative DNA transfer family protein [Ramlibacter humi]|uniref:TraD/TraG TraM recognition site domain-containing protein n=1 Tax=Ramlibacter humi TaxID=2530451 RepID=A0A4Z0BPU0_9BURK|nr:TraM recognition domain-containing protein [Ramlibacter humi]TFZ00075.1 hypothetical protein EZ216_13270 [Ramlibacter humi]
MNALLDQLLIPQYQFAIQWFGPAYFNTIMLMIMVLVWINPLPLNATEKDDSTKEAVLLWTRRIIVTAIPILAVIVPIYLCLLVDAVRVADLGADSARWARAWLWGAAKANLWRVVAGTLVAMVVKAIYLRNIAPVLSHWFHERRNTLGLDAKSDIRVTAGKLQAKDFSPVEYYKEGEVFFGLNEHGAPIYVDLETFRKANCQVIGPTRFGKGVLLGGLMDQAIRNDHVVIYVDPKDDEWLPWVMYHAAGANRRLVTMDLNGSGKQRWHPFAGGTVRERRARIIVACGLADTGSDGDFYKRAERGILDAILPKCPSGSIGSMLAALEAKGPDGKPLKENAARLYESLREWSLVPALNPDKKGLTVDDVLRNGWVCYFRGAMDDRTVLAATRIFIMEVIQAAKRMKEERAGRQLTLAVDELKFLISQELSDALATSLGHNVNIVICHQSIGDLRGPEDKTLDAAALEQGVLTNCQLKVLYRCDPDTAEWGAKLSGTRQMKVMRTEKVHTNAAGGQVYNDDHMVANEEEALIPENVLLSLPPRVGVVFTPNQLARVIYTSPVRVSKGTDLLAEHPDAAARDVGGKGQTQPVPAPGKAEAQPVREAAAPSPAVAS